MSNDVTGWKPAATCPYGQHVLVYRDYSTLGRSCWTIVIAQRVETNLSRTFGPDHDSWMDDYGGYISPPSHWMPLPSPPRPGGGDV